jgi:4-amino-4-deoxy-L-arabinose transferase-like glycosyltransferase
VLISPPRPSAPARSAALLIVLALAPLWLTGIFGRSLWTPDEPREADIAWRMSRQADWTLPQLAGRPFLEKPPLTYWISAASLSLWGDSSAAARTPNMLYAVTAAVSVGALTLSMGTDLAAAIIAALVAMSALMAFRVSIWLAPDACLLAGCGLALLGVWRGYCAAPGAAKAAGYTLMHIGAAIGFMAKSAPGWLVPALALLALILWERRWSELRRWELYAPLTVQALFICPWLLAVAHSARGAEALRTLFWNNVFGRFTRLTASADLDYTRGHHNSPGKYFLELPLYLLPWTLVVAAAAVRALGRMREVGAEGTSWRFALAASVPFLVLLSFAATARDVYAAPVLLGAGVLTGCWAHAAQRAPTRLDQLALRSSRWLIAALIWGLAAGMLILAAAGTASATGSITAALAAVAAVQLALWRAAHAQRVGRLQESLGWAYAGYAAALVVTAVVVLPVIDSWQNLAALARRIHADTADQSLALLDPDETTIAMLDHGLETPSTVLTSGAEAEPPAWDLAARGAGTVPKLLGDWFSSRGHGARVLVLLPGHAPGRLTRWLERFHPIAPPGDGIAADLLASGTATLIARYELPQGRRYALLGPPTP